MFHKNPLEQTLSGRMFLDLGWMVAKSRTQKFIFGLSTLNLRKFECTGNQIHTLDYYFSFRRIYTFLHLVHLSTDDKAVSFLWYIGCPCNVGLHHSLHAWSSSLIDRILSVINGTHWSYCWVEVNFRKLLLFFR